MALIHRVFLNNLYRKNPIKLSDRISRPLWSISNSSIGTSNRKVYLLSTNISRVRLFFFFFPSTARRFIYLQTKVVCRRKSPKRIHLASRWDETDRETSRFWGESPCQRVDLPKHTHTHRGKIHSLLPVLVSPRLVGRARPRNLRFIDEAARFRLKDPPSNQRER